ncbi:general odorant-binding protein 72-like [Tribolium madens]|uniref:general odorant-binding protein 72-like n=1 Tax=Tribolium madens TaxID=41895 RepID=UPI001CF74054|nr:general odorant-binding protein 72-like [Tribolium madens]
MKAILLLLVATLSFYHVYCAMTEAQMKATLKLVRNTCQPKSKATNEQIEGMHSGNWDLDKNGKCYMWCILNMYKLIGKDNSFNWEAGIAVLKAQAPETVRDPAIASVNNCKDAVKTASDKCEAAYEIAHCMYLDNPEKYFLP